jgi:cysteine desulfurase
MGAAWTYLDYNATAPVRPEVLARVAEVMTVGGNPSSVHRFGRLARAFVDRARDSLAEMVGVDAEQVVFTSGATEANALGLRSLARRVAPGSRVCGASRVLISAIEHDSIVGTAHALDLPVETIPVTGDGVVDLGDLKAMLGAGGTAVVALMLANNETGVIQPVAAAAALVHSFGGMLHCDAVQAAGRTAIDFGALGADTLALSSHKIAGPAGAGAVVARDISLLSPMLIGGGQERGLRAGTENTACIAGFGLAAEMAAQDLRTVSEIKTLRDDLERRLQVMAPSVRVFGAAAERLPNTSCFALVGLDNETQVIALDLAGAAVSAGAACSSGKVTASRVLRAMGAPDSLSRAAIRVSLGWASSPADIDRFCAAWSKFVTRHEARAATMTRRVAAGVQ